MSGTHKGAIVFRPQRAAVLLFTHSYAHKSLKVNALFPQVPTYITCYLVNVTGNHEPSKCIQRQCISTEHRVSKRMRFAYCDEHNFVNRRFGRNKFFWHWNSLIGFSEPQVCTKYTSRTFRCDAWNCHQVLLRFFMNLLTRARTDAHNLPSLPCIEECEQFKLLPPHAQEMDWRTVRQCHSFHSGWTSTRVSYLTHDQFVR